MERRRASVREGLPKIPKGVLHVLLGYCKPSEEDMWDEVAGVPLEEDGAGSNRERDGSGGARRGPKRRRRDPGGMQEA